MQKNEYIFNIEITRGEGDETQGRSVVYAAEATSLKLAIEAMDKTHEGWTVDSATVTRGGARHRLW